DSQPPASSGEDIDVRTFRGTVRRHGIVGRRVNVADAKRLERARRVQQAVGDQAPASPGQKDGKGQSAPIAKTGVPPHGNGSAVWRFCLRLVPRGAIDWVFVRRGAP